MTNRIADTTKALLALSNQSLAMPHSWNHDTGSDEFILTMRVPPVKDLNNILQQEQELLEELRGAGIANVVYNASTAAKGGQMVIRQSDIDLDQLQKIAKELEFNTPLEKITDTIRPVQKEDLALLESLGFDRFPPTVTDGKWKLVEGKEGNKIARLVLRFPPAGKISNELEVLIKRLPEAVPIDSPWFGVQIEQGAQGKSAGYGELQIINLDATAIDPKELELNKPQLTAQIGNYGAQLAAELGKFRNRSLTLNDPLGPTP